VLQTAGDEPFLEKTSRRDTPILVSEDGKCRLAIIGWIKTVEWVQWYDFSAEPGGVLESEGHQRGSVESLSVSAGELEVEVGGAIERARPGETLRYRCDRPHTIRNVSQETASATMVCILKAAAME
jgi:quercetin dioxygenase-like cupin family protein